MTIISTIAEKIVCFLNRAFSLDVTAAISVFQKKQRLSYCCNKPFHQELNSILMHKLSFVLMNEYGRGGHEQIWRDGKFNARETQGLIYCKSREDGTLSSLDL